MNRNEYESVGESSDRLLTVVDVANWLNVHPDTVRRYERDDLIESVILNETPRYRTIRFKRSAVERFIKARSNEIASDSNAVQKIDKSKLSVRKFAGRV